MTTQRPVVKNAYKLGGRVAAWTPIERILAVICAVSPLVMWWVDPKPLRESISAYFAMADNQWFYVPLAVGAMLFIVNGITKGEHWYNWVLGTALVGVLMFNTNDWSTIHMIFAVVFFGGNVVVMIWWSDADPRFRYGFAAVVVVVMIVLATGNISVWLAEFLSLLVIAAHYILDSVKEKRWADWYNALPRGENPWSRGDKTASTKA